jgi:phosphate-selective porin OprO/OprP
MTFLQFNNNVVERGNRALWELHTAYYKGGLSLIGAWQGGVESYGRIGAGAGGSVKVPIGGFFVQGGYLLTGETLRDRTLIDPIRPFDLRPGRFGLGAFEVTARYSELDLGRQVFTAGLADQNLWTRSVQMTDVGFNWYMSKFVKLYFDWEHSLFGQPVAINIHAPQKLNDLFWLRFQVYF